MFNIYNVCPITGQTIYLLKENDFLLCMDGPSIWKTVDGKYTYERWPRARDYLFLVGPEKRNFVIFGDQWKEFVYCHGEAILLEDPDFESKSAYLKTLKEFKDEQWEEYYRFNPGEKDKLSKVVRPLFISNDLVQVKPMALPDVTICYLDFSFKPQKQA